jgi:hypothetical protein
MEKEHENQVFAASLLALAAIAPAANAMTVQNLDKMAYRLMLTPTGGKAMEVDVKANAKADVDCAKGCTISFDGKTQTCDGKAALVKIKDGKFAI